MQLLPGALSEAVSSTARQVVEFTSTTTVSPQSAAILQMCRLWSHINKSPTPEPPSFCQDILRDYYADPTAYDDRLIQLKFAAPKHPSSSISGERAVGIDTVDNLSFTGRSLSLVGVLGGVLFILIIIAFVSCLKHRKRIRDEDSEVGTISLSSHIRQVHQARASHYFLTMFSASSSEAALNPPPPDYETVLRMTEKDEEDLPSYLEAIKSLQTIPEEGPEQETEPKPET